MIVKEKNRRREDFIEWITFLPDRVIEFKKFIPKEISDRLDESPQSLKVIEKYIIGNYSVEELKNPDNKSTTDGFASYIGYVFQKNLPHAKWSIELEDKSDYAFALPVISNEKLVPFSPFHMLPSLLYFNDGEQLEKGFNAKLNACNN